MPGLAPPNNAAGVNPKAGGADAGGPGRAIAFASVAPNALASGSCANRGQLSQTWAQPTQPLSHSSRCSQARMSLFAQDTLTEHSNALR